MGRALLAMKARSEERQKLFDQSWDAGEVNPNIAPSFGRHGAIAKSDANLVVNHL